MVDPRKDEPDTLRQGSGDMLPPLWDRLVAELGQRQSLIRFTGADVRPIMLDRFEVRRCVGAGGMGVVFEAFDPELGRRVALKVCKTPSADAATEIEHEARCLAKLSHPNIVAVPEIVRFGLDVVLVMEFVEGQTLREWQTQTGPSWRAVLDRYVDAGRALAAVHAAGLEHGDFKPDNVMIDHQGRVRVVDFGIARYSVEPSDASDAGEIDIKGTRPYMPPERLMEKPGGPLADVYAFCVSVWESLYGVRPYAGKTVPALLESIEAGKLETGKVAALVVPDAVRVVLARGLHARASERPPSMDELLRALGDACEGALGRRARWWRRLGGGLVVGLVIASVVMATMLVRAPEQAAAVGIPTLLPESPPGAVAQTLALAAEAARAGHPDSTLTYLELARQRAHVDNDKVALRDVALHAEQLGDFLLARSLLDHTITSWDLAKEVFVELRDRTSVERLKLKITTLPRRSR